MRKIIAVMAVLVIVFALSPSVKAANMAYSASPQLSFSGTTATCSLEVFAGGPTDSIQATITLRHGNTIVSQWSNLSASGYMDFSDTASVAHGQTYTMQVSLKVNGVSCPVPSITRTCP